MAKKKQQGDGSVFLRKDGRWEGRIVVGYKENGYPQTKSVTAQTQTECKEKLAKLREEYGRRSERLKNVIAANYDIDQVDLDRLRGICVNEVKKINGSISFDEAIRWQS